MTSDLEQLRHLRKLGAPLLLNLTQDLQAFLNTANLTFRRRPEQANEQGDVKVTTTCSCLMAIAQSRRCGAIYKPYTSEELPLEQLLENVFHTLFNAKWESSGLAENNPFSTVLVIRASSFLVTSGAIKREVVLAAKRNFLGQERTITEIAKTLLENADLSQFRINAYPPKAAVVYWFVDAVDRLNLKLDGTHWQLLSGWAGSDFRKQRSLVLARHESLMDPIAMAMAACLCARLRNIAGKQEYSVMTECLRALPTPIELVHSVEAVFEQQGKSGIWPKYFPLFHYPNAGSNFCFTFEMLEAVLTEFGSGPISILDNLEAVSGLRRAVDWCFQNRLHFPLGSTPYNGWNSGGELDSLNDGKPESWATAVVHMFLRELDHVLAERIQRHILDCYNATPGERYSGGWDKIIDVPLTLKTREQTTLKSFLSRNIIKSSTNFAPDTDNKIGGRVSALLFGPPGTSKTRLTRAIAGVLNWPIVELDPSAFLSKGMENIYSRADEIFRDLLDLSGAVVLFDEMDALVQTRGADEQLDITRQFLTTSMLPKLAKLHDHGRIIFFFATNYQSKFDQAIKRPGRFDLLVFMGPPPWQNTLDSLGSFVRDEDKPFIPEIKAALEGFTKQADAAQRECLDKLTFQEKQNFFEVLRKETSTLAEALKNTHKDTFFKSLEDYSKFITLRTDAPDFKQWWETERNESGLQ